MHAYVCAAHSDAAAWGSRACWADCKCRAKAPKHKCKLGEAQACCWRSTGAARMQCSRQGSNMEGTASAWELQTASLLVQRKHCREHRRHSFRPSASREARIPRKRRAMRTWRQCRPRGWNFSGAGSCKHIAGVAGPAAHTVVIRAQLVRSASFSLATQRSAICCSAGACVAH